MPNLNWEVANPHSSCARRAVAFFPSPGWDEFMKIASQKRKENKEEKIMDKKLYLLFEITVIDNKEKKIILHREPVIARNQEGAKFNADIHKTLKEKKLSIEDVTIVCECVCEIKE